MRVNTRYTNSTRGTSSINIRFNFISLLIAIVQPPIQQAYYAQIISINIRFNIISLLIASIQPPNQRTFYRKDRRNTTTEAPIESMALVAKKTHPAQAKLEVKGNGKQLQWPGAARPHPSLWTQEAAGNSSGVGPWLTGDQRDARPGLRPATARSAAAADTSQLPGLSMARRHPRRLSTQATDHLFIYYYYIIIIIDVEHKIKTQRRPLISI